MTSWVDQGDIPVHVMRYEDMRRDPFQVFEKALKFLHLDVSKEAIEKALNNSDLSMLQEQEQKQGFKEKMIKADKFFRKGKPGEWREVLTEEQVETVVKEHSEVMRRFGYLDEEGNIV